MSAHIVHGVFVHSSPGRANQSLKTHTQETLLRQMTFSIHTLTAHTLQGIIDISGEITGHISALKSALCKTPHGSPLILHSTYYRNTLERNTP